MKRRNMVSVACAVSLVAVALAGQSTAGTAEKTMYLTFSGPVRLPGVSLDAGTYVFEIANPDTNGDVVRVTSRDHRKAYFQGFTYKVDKPPGLRSDAVVSLGETARGIAPPIRTWWLAGQNSGRQFIYKE